MTKISLYELATRDDRRPSPFCWRAKYALAHKGLAFETIPVGFTEIPSLCGGGYKTVPIVRDGDKTVGDSWVIADYLDEAYPDKPAIFASDAERSLCRYLEASVFLNAGRHMLGMVILDIYNVVKEEDKAYFRKSREERLGCTLEEAASGREDKLPVVRSGFDAVRHAVTAFGPFMCGKSPGYADYMVASSLLWWASVATLPLFKKDDAILPWLGRIQDLYDGLGHKYLLNPIAE